jgi:hypothetical protein
LVGTAEKKHPWVSKPRARTSHLTGVAIKETLSAAIDLASQNPGMKVLLRHWRACPKLHLIEPKEC